MVRTCRVPQRLPICRGNNSTVRNCWGSLSKAEENLAQLQPTCCHTCFGVCVVQAKSFQGMSLDGSWASANCTIAVSICKGFKSISKVSLAEEEWEEEEEEVRNMHSAMLGLAQDEARSKTNTNQQKQPAKDSGITSCVHGDVILSVPKLEMMTSLHEGMLAQKLVTQRNRLKRVILTQAWEVGQCTDENEP